MYTGKKCTILYSVWPTLIGTIATIRDTAKGKFLVEYHVGTFDWVRRDSVRIEES